jgi:hypothetical protein
MAALSYAVNSAPSAVRSRIDTSKQAVAGHSMGGGGSMIAARDNASLKASFPMTPWNTSTSFGSVRVPTMIIGADGDTVAAVTAHSRPMYASLPSSTFKAYGELNSASHFTPNSTNTPIGRYGVTWMKRFVDGDTRYSPFLCGSPHESYATSLVFDRYQQNCRTECPAHATHRIATGPRCGCHLVAGGGRTEGRCPTPVSTAGNSPTWSPAQPPPRHRDCRSPHRQPSRPCPCLRGGGRANAQ